MITIIRVMKLQLQLHPQVRSVPVVLSCRSSSTYCLVSVQVHVQFTLCHIASWTGKSEYYLQHCHEWIINCVVPSMFDWEEWLYSNLSPTLLKIEPPLTQNWAPPTQELQKIVFTVTILKLEPHPLKIEPHSLKIEPHPLKNFRR